MIAYNSNLYCLLKHGDPINKDSKDEYSIVKYNTINGIKDEVWFPSTDSTIKITYGIGQEDGAITPFTLSKSENGSSIVTIYKMF